MSPLEDLQPNAAVRGILPDALVTVVSVQWFGGTALELTYKTPAGKVANELLYRTDEQRIEVVEKGRPWSFDGDGALFRLVSEALRIRLAHLFDPVLAVHTSMVEPLPHQITAVHEAMMPRQPPPVPPGGRSGRREDNHGGAAHEGAAGPRRPPALGRDAGRIADEVISHLGGIVGAAVRVTIEIEADIPGGVPDKVVRIVTENARTLKFESQGFEDA